MSVKKARFDMRDAFVRDLVDTTTAILAEAIRLRFIPGRPTGGCLLITNANVGKVPATTHVIGKISSPASDGDLIMACLEKANRLTRMASSHGHVLSWQSRDPRERQYAGAVRLGDFIIVFSGLSEFYDEGLVLMALVEAGYMEPEDAAGLAAISGNEEYPRFLTCSVHF